MASVPLARDGEQSTEGPAGSDPAPPPLGRGLSMPSVGTWAGPREEARYECLEPPVGGGAEGIVYRGRYVGPNGGTPMTRAIKIYRRPPHAPPDWPDDGTWLDIKDQTALLQNITPSPRLVRIHDAFLGELASADRPTANAADPTAFRTPVLVMEWLDGRSLTVELRDHPASVAQRLTWISQLAQAVELIHSASRTFGNPLVHTDIKPDNCMITPDRGLVLVDTGAVHRANASHNRRGLRTPAYAAPEVLADPGRPPSIAGDLYSLGAVTYYVLTGEPPPGSGDSGYLSQARARLEDVAQLGPGQTRATQRLVTAHVLTLLDPDPARRARATPTVWADQLAGLVRHRRRLWAGLVAGGAAFLLVLVLTGLGFLTKHQPGGPVMPYRAAKSSTRAVGSPSGEASTQPPNTVLWDTLPTAPALGTLAFTSSLSRPAAGWPASRTKLAVNRYAGGGYVLQPLTRSYYDMVQAPSTVMTSVETVTATASLQSGQGVWGVWCRGTSGNPAESYTFLLSHAGAVSISGPQGLLTDWRYLQGIDVSKQTTLTARCADANPGPVQLTLSVNGRQVLTTAVTTDLLGPGYSGIMAGGFADVTGPIAQFRFTRYAIFEG